ncbi:MAG TPA: GNAT family N-acetyltransferase [Ktedonobacteraceae bacterium]|nr:GNAT family N-acetyltransferase [Ktedonobacteraceae bacterium]
MTIIMCPYMPATDTQRILDFRRACTTRENINDYPTIADLYEILSRISASSQERIELWEDEHGAIVAYAIVALRYCNLYFLLHPHVQNSEIAAQVLEWGWDRIRGADTCTAVDTPCRDTDQRRVALLEQHGFTCSDMQTLYMARSLAEAIPPPQFPAGFTLRHVAGENEVEEVVVLHQDAFGTRNMTRDGRLSIMRNPEYIPELDLLLVAPDGRLAAFCYCAIPKEANAQNGHNEGEVAIIGTAAAYKNRGLGRAMLLAGLRSLKQFGIETATLGTSSENVKAQSVFTAAGFHTVYKTLWYSKGV